MRRLTAVLVVVIFGCLLYYRNVRKSNAPAAQVEQSGAPVSAAAQSRGSFDPATRVAVVHAKDFAFEAPDSITAGWTTFHFLNDGPNLHHLQIVRLDSGKTVQDLAAVFAHPGPMPGWATLAGGPNAPNPGAGSDGMVDLAAGNYALICLVDIPGGVPHVAKGMIHALTVTAGGAEGAEPAADETVTLADYNFAIKGSFKSGQHTIKVINNGPQPHEIELVQLAPGKTPKDLMDWIAKPDGPPPGNAIGGVTALMPGLAGYFTASLAPGKYLLICFIPDAKDGKPHAEHGMMKEITIN